MLPLVLAYGCKRPGREISELLKKRRDEVRKAKEEPEEALRPLQPQTEEKK